MTKHPICLLLLGTTLLGSLAVAQDRTRSKSLERKLELTTRKEHAAVLTRALTWLTGGSEENDYVSVGRLANYFGFVRFRVESGHSISRGSIGQQVYGHLNQSQRQAMRELLREQWSALEACREARERINRELEGMLSGGASSSGTIENLGREFGRREAGLGYVQAKGFGAIIASLSAPQLRRLRKLRATGLAGRAESFKLPRDLKDELRRLQHQEVQEFYNLTSRLLTWATGSPADNDYDTAGKPSQHFGFVSLRLESGHGVTRGAVTRELGGVFNNEQQQRLRAVVGKNREDFDEFFAQRGQTNRALEAALTRRPIEKSRVLEHGAAQGAAEARMTWRMARAYLDLRASLAEQQIQKLLALRQQFTAASAAVEDGADLLAVGRRTFATCALCHLPHSGGASIGPALAGLFDRRIAAADFRYSPAMKALATQQDTWTETRLDRFLAAPQREVPGTSMGFTGVPDATRRKALIAYLRTLGSTAKPEQTPALVAKPPRRSRTPKRTTVTRSTASRPNIVFMMSDDQSWNGLSVSMHPRLDAKSRVVQTPNLEQLAQQGMRFSDAYAPAPVCAATRISLQIGKSPAALHWTKAAKSVRATDGYKLIPPVNIRNISERESTIGELLQRAGYRTAHYGKWHIQGGGPGRHGYDAHDGNIGNEYAERFKDPNPADIFGMARRAAGFMAESQKAGKPFFIQLSWHALHAPENALQKTLAKYQRQGERGGGKKSSRAAIAEDLDTGVGMVLEALDELGLSDSTYVIYTSDNGGGGGGGQRGGEKQRRGGRGRQGNKRGGAGASLNGGKGSLYEGGIRVPLIVRGPGIKPNSFCTVPVMGVDWFPTYCQWAGIQKLPKDLEGGSLTTLLGNAGKGSVQRRNEGLCFHFPHYQSGHGPHSSIRFDQFKLIKFYETDRVALFDLSKDLAEQRDVSQELPKKAQELHGQLRKYLAGVKADLPQNNPRYDPSKPPSSQRKRRRR